MNRKILCPLDAPYIKSIMRLIETQSKTTLGNWGLSYAKDTILPIWETHYPADNRPREALVAAREWFDGKIKLPECKRRNFANVAAKEAKNPDAQAAASACAQAALIAHTPRHSIGFVLYGITAIAYDNGGTPESECAKMESALRAVAVENEPNPVKINWDTFIGEGTLFWRQAPQKQDEE